MTHHPFHLRKTAAPAAGRLFVAVLLLAALLVAARIYPASERKPMVVAVGDITVTVLDMDRAMAFYRDVLTFEPDFDMTLRGDPLDSLIGLPDAEVRLARMRLNREAVVLAQFIEPRGRPFPRDDRSQDRSFQHVAVIVSDMDAAYSRLRKAGVVHVSPAPQRLPDWNRAAGGIRAFYFRDPESHTLEVLQFPRGKGDPRWSEAGDRLFLGIDHTAIVVDDSERSLRFYHNALGLEVVGESENYGPEQERLNHVPGAHLRITTLRAAAGPGVELLEYLAPGDGRDYPGEVRVNDAVHWQTTMIVGDVHAALTRIRESGGTIVSPRAVRLPHWGTAAAQAAIVRDPDGHALLLLELPPKE